MERGKDRINEWMKESNNLNIDVDKYGPVWILKLLASKIIQSL